MNSFSVKAPTRVDLAGGTLDIWPLYCFLSPTRTINLAINIFARCDFSFAPGNTLSWELETPNHPPVRFRSVSPKPKEFELLSKAYQFPAFILAEFMRTHGFPNGALRIQYRGEAPMGSGLGGSSTLCVALTWGLSHICRVYQEQGWQWTFLDWVRDVEASYLKTVTGTQDYLAALFGGLNTFVCDVGGIKQAPVDASLAVELERRLVVLFSGEMHHSGISNWELFKRVNEGDSATFEGLAAINRVAHEMDRHLRAPSLNWKAIGGLLDEEWRVRQTVFRVDTPRLVQITQALKEFGVLGSKVCGAAQGGSLIALVDPERKLELVEVCKREGIQVLNAQVSTEGVGLSISKK